MPTSPFVVASHTHWDREWYQPRHVILSATHAGAQNPALREGIWRRGGV